MEAPGADGAAAAAAHFLDLYEYAYDGLDSTPLAQMSSPECSFCRSVVDDVARLAAYNHVSTGGEYSIVNAFGQEITPEQWYSAAVQLDQAPGAEVDSVGKVVSESAGGRFQMVFALDWAQGWLVREVDVTAIPESTS